MVAPLGYIVDLYIDSSVEKPLHESGLLLSNIAAMYQKGGMSYAEASTYDVDPINSFIVEAIWMSVILCVLPYQRRCIRSIR